MIISNFLVDLVVKRAKEQHAIRNFDFTVNPMTIADILKEGRGKLSASNYERLRHILADTHLDARIELIGFANEHELWHVINVLVDKMVEWDSTEEGWYFWNSLDDYAGSQTLDSFWQSFNECDYMQMALTDEFNDPNSD